MTPGRPTAAEPPAGSDPTSSSPTDATTGSPVDGTQVGASEGVPGTSTRSRVIGVVVLTLVVAALVYAVVRNRQAFVDTAHRAGPGGLALSTLLAVLGVAATAMQWRAVLGGLGVPLGLRDGSRVFYVSQLGKYLPGSVWPVVMQMEAGRQRGASRTTVLAGNLVTLVLGMMTGLVVSGLLLPFSSPDALRQFWWALAALPLVVVLALPRTLPFLLDLALRMVRRPPMQVQMTGSATVRASLWATLSWLLFGAHLLVLVGASQPVSWRLAMLCIGGMALAVPAGILFVPAPAGAGMREVVLGFVLGTALEPGQVVAVVVGSRVLLIVADALLAAAAAALVRPQP